MPTPLRTWLDAKPSTRALVAGVTVLAGLAFLAGLTGLRDEDTFHLLSMGREIARRGGAPATEPFLFPLANVPFGFPPAWLSSCAIYSSQLLLGDAGPVLLAALLLAAIVLLLTIDSVDRDFTWSEALLSLVPIVLAVAILRPRAVARPEMFANVLLGATLLIVRRHEASGTRAIWAIPVLTVAWANFHQSALAAVAVVGAYTIGTAALRVPAIATSLRDPPPWRRVGTAALVLATTLVASGASLSQSSPFRSVLAFVIAQRKASADLGSGASGVMGMMKNSIAELQPLSTGDWLGPFGALVLLAAASAVFARRPSLLRELLTCGGFVMLALPTRRFMAQAAVVLAPIAARGLVHAVRRLGPGTGGRLLAGTAAALGALALAVRLQAQSRLPFGVALAPEKFPVRAAEYLRDTGFEGQLFNTFHFGGYLEWTLDRPVFQDGRGFLRPADVAGALSGPSHPAAFDGLDERYRFDALVLAYPIVDPDVRRRLASTRERSDWFVPSERWGLVAFDDGGLLYLRRDGRYGHLLKRDEFRAVLPVADFPIEALASPQGPDSVLNDLRRAVREAPRCEGCRRWLGMALLATGASGEARDVAGPGLGEVQRALDEERDRVQREARRGRASRLHAEGRARVQANRPAEAVPLLRSALDADPGDPIRLDLSYALLAAGRAAEARVEIDGLLAQSPDFADAHFVHGLVLEALGRREEALGAYRAFLALEPEGEEAPAARQRISALSPRR